MLLEWRDLENKIAFHPSLPFHSIFCYFLSYVSSPCYKSHCVLLRLVLIHRHNQLQARKLERLVCIWSLHCTFKLRNWKGCFVYGAKLLKSSLFPTANTMQTSFIICFFKICSSSLTWSGSSVARLHYAPACFLPLHLEENHVEATVRQSLEAEIRLTFPCLLAPCTVRAVIEWISQ